MTGEERHMDYDKYIELYRQGHFEEAIAYKSTQIEIYFAFYF